MFFINKIQAVSPGLNTAKLVFDNAEWTVMYVHIKTSDLMWSFSYIKKQTKTRTNKTRENLSFI